MSANTTWTKEDSRKAIEKKKTLLQAAFAKLKSKLTVNGQLLTEDRQCIVKLPFHELRRQLQCGELLSRDVLQAYQSKALVSTEKLNNVTEFIPQSEEWANERDKTPISERKLLHGIPISLKDVFDIAGMDSTDGLAKNLFKTKAEYAVIVQILLEQGAVPFCKTNIPICCRSYSAQNAIFGTTLNPWKQDRTPGGSSGGEGSLIGDGGSILGIGTDLCGSIRMPCHACGIYGLRPSTSRISQVGEATGGAGMVGMQSAGGFMSRYPEAIAAGMEALLSPDVMFRKDPDLMPIIWKKETANENRKLRIGYTFGAKGFPLTPGPLRGLKMAKEGLESAGHTLVPIEFPDLSGIMDIAKDVLMVEEGALMLKLMEGEIIEEPMLETWYEEAVHHTKYSAADYMQAFAKKLAFKKELTDIWRIQNLDVVLGPISCAPAASMENIPHMFHATVYIAMVNMCNLTAAVIPTTFETNEDQAKLNEYPESPELFKNIKNMTIGAQGMPIGVQLMALPFREETLCYAMKQLEIALKMKKN